MGKYLNSHGTKSPVLAEARIADTWDPFGWAQGWRFSLAQYLTDKGEYVADFRGVDEIREGYEYEMLTEIEASVNDATYALKILDRYRVWLGLAGKDY